MAVKDMTPDNKRIIAQNLLHEPFVFGAIRDHEPVIVDDSLTLSMFEKILGRLNSLYRQRYSREHSVPAKEVKVP